MRLVRFFAALKFFQDLCQQGLRADRTRQKLQLLQNCFPLRDCAWLPMIAILITPQISIQTEVPKDNDPKTSSAFLNAQQVACFSVSSSHSTFEGSRSFSRPFHSKTSQISQSRSFIWWTFGRWRGVCLKQLFVHAPPSALKLSTGAVGCRGMPWVAVGCHWAVPSLVKPCSYVGEVNGGGQAFEVEVISIYLGYVEVVPGLRRPGTPIARWKRRNRCYGATIVQSIQPVEWTGLPKGFFLSHPWSEGIEASRGSILGVCWWCLFIMVTPSSATPAPFFSIDLGYHKYHNETWKIVKWPSSPPILQVTDQHWSYLHFLYLFFELDEPIGICINLLYNFIVFYI